MRLTLAKRNAYSLITRYWYLTDFNYDIKVDYADAAAVAEEFRRHNAGDSAT